MVPKGKNIGLSQKERKEWTKQVVLEVLTDHLCLDIGSGTQTSLSETMPLYEMATQENIAKAVSYAGLLNIVAYVHNNVFRDADQLEEEAFNRVLLAKQHEWFEAVDLSIGEPRRRKVAHYVYPFLQEAARNQPNLGAYVRRFLSCSPPEKLSQAIRMRKYAIEQQALGKFVQDNPKDLANFYWNSILQDLQVESLPENLHQLAIAMIQAGSSKESITNAIKQVNFGESQTIPPSSKSFNGFTFQIVPKTDEMVIKAADINDSCMHLGGVAHDCVIDILSNPRAALLIIKKEQHDAPSTEQASLRDQGYVGYSYIRHGLSNTIYLDNVELVEQDEEGKKKVLSIALHDWILSMMQDLDSKSALIGKAYSQGILDDLSLPQCHLSRDQLFQDMPDDVQTYSDLCKEHGAWKITVDARTVTC